MSLKVELLSITPNAEKHIELCGRTAYKTENKITDDSEKLFIKMIIARGHLSVLEHAVATFRISGVSRALTHQLTRHRLCSFTQRSQRFVKETGFDFVEPEAIKNYRNGYHAHVIFGNLIDEAKQAYRQLLELGIKKEDARFVLPNAAETEIVLTANFRELKHIIDLRTAPDAQWEIRNLFLKIQEILREHAPTVFR